MTDEPLSFIDYWDPVAAALINSFGIDTSDPGIEPELIAGVQEEGQTPEEFARWFGKKHRLEYIANWKVRDSQKLVVNRQEDEWLVGR
jgi:hypothetical protein